MILTTFLYFAYGSNLLAERIHINCPTAVRREIGYLKDYRLDFNGYSENWKGAPATIVPTNGTVVWGSIWEIDLIDLPALDKQEGVASNVYFPFEVDIQQPDGGRNSTCRTYEMSENPKEYVNLSSLPPDRQPSATYMMTIINGAGESGLSQDYINFLKTVKHNGHTGGQAP